MPTEIVRAYIDETGDRGYKPSSSKYFAFAAVVVRERHVQTVEAALDAARATLQRAQGSPLHWSQNLKDHRQRKVVAQHLAALPVRLIYVCAPKAAITGYLAQSQEGYYNYLARLMVERVGLFARSRESLERKDDPTINVQAKVTFARVRGFKPSVLQDYITKVRSDRKNSLWSDYLTPRISVSDHAQDCLLQWADIAAGAFDAAAKQDAYGNHETKYLDTISKLVHRGPNGNVFGCGIKCLGGYGWLTAIPEWPGPLHQ